MNMRKTESGSKPRDERQKIVKTQLELQAILDHAPIGIWMVDVDGQYRFVNKTFCNAIGIPESAFLATDDVTKLMGEETGGNCLASDQACLAQNEPHLSYETLPFVDGKSHLMEITKAKVRDEAGEVIGVVGIGMDITEQRATKEKLRKLSQAVEQAGESILITDKEGTIEYVNPSFTKITGYAAEEVLGRNPNMLKSGEQAGEYYDRLWKTICNGEVWQSSIVDRRKDGSRFPSMLSISPINDSNGQITHYVGIQQDMTEHELLEAKFRQSQKMEALGTLVGGIAHDFNNMLTGMAGNLYLAKERVADFPDVVEKLDAVEKLSYRAAAMIKQLMIFARKGSVEKKPFGLTAFLKETCKLHAVSIPGSISFRTEFCHDELVVSGDTTQLQQVLLNLLNNARDAVAGMPDPAISLTVEQVEADESFMIGHSLTGSRSFAHLVVKDNGSGISDAYKDHIFEPFFTTKEVGAGTGLGLAMSYGTIQAHGGILEVDSTLGNGSSFHIYLPIIAERNIESESGYFTEVASGNGEFILIADDDAGVRASSKDVLEKLGYRVLEASDGLEAVAVFTANRESISLVIMDIIMPKLGGLQAAERIRALCPDAKVVFSTGYDKERLLKGEMPSDESVFLYKPYSVQNFSQMVREQLGSTG